VAGCESREKGRPPPPRAAEAVQKHERPAVAEFVLTHEPITDPHLTEFWFAVHRPSLDRHDRPHQRLIRWAPI